MSLILLSLSYWLHLLGTVIWLGGLAATVLLTLPAWRRQELDDNLWVDLQRRLVPWINGSLIVLLVTGFFQMTWDVNYGDFLVLDGVWAWAMLLKHIAFGLLAALTLYLQFVLYPEMNRLQLLARQKPETAAARRAEIQAVEIRLLWVNVGCAAAILLLTAIMTAV